MILKDLCTSVHTALFAPRSGARPDRACSLMPERYYPVFPLWTFCPIDNIHLTTTDRNCQSGLQCQVLPQQRRVRRSLPYSAALNTIPSTYLLTSKEESPQSNHLRHGITRYKLRAGRQDDTESCPSSTRHQASIDRMSRLRRRFPHGATKSKGSATCFVGPRHFAPATTHQFGSLLPLGGLARKLPACPASPQSGRKIVANGASRGAIGPPPPSPFRGERNHDQM